MRTYSMTASASAHRPYGVAIAALVIPVVATALVVPHAHADNNRLNRSVVQMVSVVQYRAGCHNHLKINPQLQLAAQWHTLDVLNNPVLLGDTGTDGSGPQDRANAAGFRGKVEETVAVHPALAISGLELINAWYHDADLLGVMRNCANTEIGVWSENRIDRTVVVAVYGQPQ
ncbi:CAP domain-containing protein [Mycolicibacterium vanbaalenii PYR-1]|uniref:SCP domain-containing protein n=1 Tax=Mycolicibacterium vanbaalenii (strain DSM 7251 / JCM 13017 / BCRC 16820 / KCTC 9966 / NRRL B-24157 / PYR-1) TaxID=350058 RepID=A1T3K5_MYCVP|nr:conserved hypothetical protein [Mycolicibacterium vanbaalenii PYR-1]MCV7127874.1 CAP domain-containing protein [Mycolicibacterium vanbaalenii PYR-1]